MVDRAKELCYLTVAQAGPLLRERKLSPVELTRAYLERIAAVDDKLHSYATVLPERALAQARSAEAELLRGRWRGPLHGVPVALKDLYDTKGIRTTGNSRVIANRVPDADAACVERLNAAGTVLLGKLVMHEFALGGPDPTSLFPPARNPWNLAHMPGGSSSGSGAAVAAGLCMASLGSDTGGSIRGPASLCSIVGLKPTYGRVSNYGVLPLSWSQDHCGPMTASVEDAALALQAIAGPDARDLTTADVPVPDYTSNLKAGVKGLTVGVPRRYFYEPGPDVDGETLAAVEQALRTLTSIGAVVRDVDIPHIAQTRPANHVIMATEAFAYHEASLRARPQDFGDMVRARFLLGGLFSAADYAQALRVRGLIRQEMAAALREADVLVTPTSPKPAALLEGYDITTTAGGPSFMAPFNLSGLPAISIPGGFTSAGLPIGLQIAGKPFDEATVLRVAYAYEQEARWFERRPPI